jgi:hypothetical protein
MVLIRFPEFKFMLYINIQHMSSLQEAFKLSVNQENKDFVMYPYIAINTNEKGKEIDRRLLTVGRCFDMVHGAKNSFAPTYSS